MLVLGAVGLWSLNAAMAKVIVDSGGLTPLGEEISDVQILGGILVLGGIVLAQTARFGAV
jgi:hypothetical protein